MPSDVAHAIVVMSYIDMSSDVAHVIVVTSYMHARHHALMDLSGITEFPSRLRFCTNMCLIINFNC